MIGISVVVVTGIIVGAGAMQMERHGDRRYHEGVLDGQCERDCQYTHDDSLGVSVTGHVNGNGDCVCRRELGEPNWGAP